MAELAALEIKLNYAKTRAAMGSRSVEVLKASYGSGFTLDQIVSGQVMLEANKRAQLAGTPDFTRMGEVYEAVGAPVAIEFWAQYGSYFIRAGMPAGDLPASGVRPGLVLVGLIRSADLEFGPDLRNALTPFNSEADLEQTTMRLWSLSGYATYGLPTATSPKETLIDAGGRDHSHASEANLFGYITDLDWDRAKDEHGVTNLDSLIDAQKETQEEYQAWLQKIEALTYWNREENKNKPRTYVKPTDIEGVSELAALSPRYGWLIDQFPDRGSASVWTDKGTHFTPDGWNGRPSEHQQILCRQPGDDYCHARSRAHASTQARLAFLL